MPSEQTTAISMDTKQTIAPTRPYRSAMDKALSAISEKSDTIKALNFQLVQARMEIQSLTSNRQPVRESERRLVEVKAELEVTRQKFYKSNSDAIDNMMAKWESDKLVAQLRADNAKTLEKLKEAEENAKAVTEQLARAIEREKAAAKHVTRVNDTLTELRKGFRDALERANASPRTAQAAQKEDIPRAQEASQDNFEKLHKAAAAHDTASQQNLHQVRQTSSHAGLRHILTGGFSGPARWQSPAGGIGNPLEAPAVRPAQNNTTVPPLTLPPPLPKTTPTVGIPAWQMQHATAGSGNQHQQQAAAGPAVSVVTSETAYISENSQKMTGESHSGKGKSDHEKVMQDLNKARQERGAQLRALKQKMEMLREQGRALTATARRKSEAEVCPKILEVLTRLAGNMERNADDMLGTMKTIARDVHGINASLEDITENLAKMSQSYSSMPGLEEELPQAGGRGTAEEMSDSSDSASDSVEGPMLAQAGDQEDGDVETEVDSPWPSSSSSDSMSWQSMSKSDSGDDF